MAGVSAVSAALCQSRGPARAGRCQDLVIRAISASDMPMAGPLAWQALDGELREHGSWRPGILSRRIEVRKSTSGAAACSVTERWHCGRLSRRASMMPILSRWGSTGIRHNIAQFCQRPSAGTRPGRFTAPAAEPSKTVSKPDPVAALARRFCHAMAMGGCGQCLERRRAKHSLLDAWPPPTLSLNAY
jgi:hypothetical protein